MKTISKICILIGALAVLNLPSVKSAHGQSVLLTNLKSNDGSQSSVEQSPIEQPSVEQQTVEKSPVDRTSTALVQKTSIPPSKLIKPSPRVSSILEDVDKASDSLASPETQSAGSHEDLDALLWLRTSAEYDAMTRQTYNAAIEKLGQALVDADWNALDFSEQSNSTADLPPCVIVDVDETVLDNSVFQLELIESDTEYSPKAWNAFVKRSTSPAIEGAVEFMAACRTSGVKVFFVTNREASVEASTRSNLISQGLIAPQDPDRILSKNEQPDWTSNKTSRRQAVAEKYRVLLLIGDDLNDFISAKNLSIAQRQQLYFTAKANWGRSWFVLPNPDYGNWEQATYGYQNDATIDQKRELKLKTLIESKDK